MRKGISPALLECTTKPFDAQAHLRPLEFSAEELIENAYELYAIGAITEEALNHSVFHWSTADAEQRTYRAVDTFGNIERARVLCDAQSEAIKGFVLRV